MIDIVRFYTVLVVLVIGFTSIIEEIYGWLITVHVDRLSRTILLILISLIILTNVVGWIIEHFHRK